MSKLFRERDWVSTLAVLPLLIAATTFSSALLICTLSAAIYICLLIANKYTTNFSKPLSGGLINILIAAPTTTLFDLFLQAFAWQFYAPLAGYLPLMAISAVFVADGDKLSQPHLVKIGTLAAAVIGLGALRELIGTGALFSQLEIIFGVRAGSWRLGFNDTDRGFLLSLLPAGGLIALGLLIAAKNYFSKPVAPHSSAPAKTRRVRVTGPVS